MGRPIRGFNPHLKDSSYQRKAPSKRTKKQAAYTKNRNPYAQSEQAKAAQRQREHDAGASAQQRHQTASQALLATAFDARAIEASDDPELARDAARLAYSLPSGVNVQIHVLGEQGRIKIKGFGHYGALRGELDAAGIDPSQCWWMWAVMGKAEPAPDHMSSLDAWTTPEQANALALSLAAHSEAA